MRSWEADRNKAHTGTQNACIDNARLGPMRPRRVPSETGTEEEQSGLKSIKNEDQSFGGRHGEGAWNGMKARIPGSVFTFCLFQNSAGHFENKSIQGKLKEIKEFQILNCVCKIMVGIHSSCETLKCTDNPKGSLQELNYSKINDTLRIFFQWCVFSLAR